MPMKLEISNDPISLNNIFAYFKEDFDIILSEDAIQKVKACRQYLDNTLAKADRLIYGINTGFGSLCNVAISDDEIEQLQHNLIVSHASGQGEYVPEGIARLIVLLKIKNLAFGHSGVRIEVLNQLLYLFNKKITPVIYQQGSLGASGDLAPLAHMSLVLLGEGEAWHQGEIAQTKALYDKLDIDPIRLKSKEGLALINGTQFSLAYSLHAVYHAQRLMRWSNLIAAMSLDAFMCSLDPFDSDLHRIRMQTGQIKVAEEIKNILVTSENLKQKKHSVQDPYSFRCIPQVHGASYDAIDYVSAIAERELNAVTDNPNIFPNEDKILSGGNFHAQPLALALDFLAIALSELGSISERRTYKLINGERGLPDYLTSHPGLHSGFMIPQYTAASIVSQNKQLCTPSSVDSIVSSKGQEDHVSMAANAATKIYRVVENLYSLLGIELMVAAQALEFRRPNTFGKEVEEIYVAYRDKVKKLEEDRYLAVDMNASKLFIRQNNF